MVQKGKFTKHYFEGSSRIVSKLGEGTFVHKNTGIMAGGIDYIRQNAQMQEARDNYIRGLKVPPGPPTQHGIYASPEWTGQPYPSLGWQNIRQDQEPPEGWPRPPKFNEPGDVPGPPVQYGDPITPQTVKAGYGFVPNGIREKNLYFYHPDHLGSSSYITDREGRITQHTEYIAFGEVLFEEHSTSTTMPYLFNGKELDSETGLYYYGARYYDPKVSLWLNVDPLAGRYPHISPYTYVNNNPINLIDPFGLEAEDPPTDSGGFPNGHVLTDGNDSWTRINGGWKNNNDKETQIDEVTITKKAKPKATTPIININSGLFSGWTQAQQANIDAARTRYYTAIANCEICQELKLVERFLFLDVPLIIATGGLSLKVQGSVMIGKATISVGTQILMNIEKDKEDGSWGSHVNIAKVAGDTFFTPVAGSILGNSLEMNIGIGKKGSIKINETKQTYLGVGGDLLFMRRNSLYEKAGTGKVGQTIIEIQSEIASQGLSKGLQD